MGNALFSDSLHSAHSLVWDNKRGSLFALGYDADVQTQGKRSPATAF